MLFTEIDEFVVPRPDRNKDLSQYIEDMQSPYVRCNGWQVVHHPGEPEIDLNLPIMQQRRYGYKKLYSSKTLLSKVPLEWTGGFHDPFPCPDDPKCSSMHRGLLLVHLHYCDMNLAWKRHNERLVRPSHYSNKLQDVFNYQTREEYAAGGFHNVYNYQSKQEFLDAYPDRGTKLPKAFRDIYLGENEYRI